MIIRDLRHYLLSRSIYFRYVRLDTQHVLETWHLVLGYLTRQNRLSKTGSAKVWLCYRGNERTLLGKPDDFRAFHYVKDEGS